MVTSSVISRISGFSVTTGILFLIFSDQSIVYGDIRAFQVQDMIWWINFMTKVFQKPGQMEMLSDKKEIIMIMTWYSNQNITS